VNYSKPLRRAEELCPLLDISSETLTRKEVFPLVLEAIKARSHVLPNPKVYFISLRCCARGAENLTYRYFNSSSLSNSCAFIRIRSHIHAYIRSTVFRTNCIYRNSETYSPQRKYRPLVCVKERDRRELDCVCGDAMSLKRSIRHRCLVFTRF
jgi:hypothetical protein